MRGHFKIPRERSLAQSPPPSQLAIAVDFEKAFGMIVGRERDRPTNSH